jgi:hypothetical protein
MRDVLLCTVAVASHKRPEMISKRSAEEEPLLITGDVFCLIQILAQQKD